MQQLKVCVHMDRFAFNEWRFLQLRLCAKCFKITQHLLSLLVLYTEREMWLFPWQHDV